MLVKYYTIINVLNFIDGATRMKCDLFKDIKGTIYGINIENIEYWLSRPFNEQNTHPSIDLNIHLP